MKKLVTSFVAAMALSASSAFAADMPAKAPKVAAPAPAPSPLDIAFGGVVMSDYNFRGVSQSNRGPSGGAYVEPQLSIGFGTLYVGIAAWAIDWPSAQLFTDPSAEVDLYGGWRNTWGPFAVDLGLIYYYYPKETFNGLTNNSDFLEIYAKATYAITPDITIGGNLFYTPDLLNYSDSFKALGVNADASGLYASVTGKWVTPWKWGDLGLFLSGELGHWWIDDSGFTNPAFFGPNGSPGLDPSYTYWNIGAALTYKVFTLDFRYHGTSQSQAECAAFLLTSTTNGASHWCNDTFIVSLKFDSALSQLK